MGSTAYVIRTEFLRRCPAVTGPVSHWAAMGHRFDYLFSKEAHRCGNGVWRAVCVTEIHCSAGAQNNEQQQVQIYGAFTDLEFNHSSELGCFGVVFLSAFFIIKWTFFFLVLCLVGNFVWNIVYLFFTFKSLLCMDFILLSQTFSHKNW